LQTCTIGVLPIVNRLLDRMQLESILKKHLPRDRRRLAVPTSGCLLYFTSESGNVTDDATHRACRASTTRRIVDISETVQRHQLTGDGESQVFVTQLTPL